MPYKLPSGYGLLEIVLEELSKYGGRIHNVVRACGHSDDEIDELVDSLKHGAWPSIDTFLPTAPHLLGVGKAAIASALLPMEFRSPLFPPRQPKGCWYSALVPHIIDDPDRQKTLRIITFNYDCTIERYLSKVLHSRGFKSPEVTKRLRRLRFIHVHGTLNSFTGQARRKRQLLDFETRVKRASKSLQVLHEANDSSKEFEQARNVITRATRVFFLGFGFHKDNMRRLGMDPEDNPTIAHRNWRTGKSVFATRKGIEDPQWRQVQSNYFGAIIPCTAEKTDVETFLRRHL